MNRKRIQLAERRDALTRKAATQRIELSEAIDPLRTPLRWGDQGLQFARDVARHRALFAGAVALVVMMRPKIWFTILENGWMAWRLLLAAKRKLDLNK